MKKPVFRVIIMLMVLNILGSGCIVSPQPDIHIADFHADEHWSVGLGCYADCTVSLVNYGDGNGIATVRLETSSGRYLDEFDLFVASKGTARRTVRVDTDCEDKSVVCKLVGQRKA
jgi:hypothetical protein